MFYTQIHIKEENETDKSLHDIGCNGFINYSIIMTNNTETKVNHAHKTKKMPSMYKKLSLKMSYWMAENIHMSLTNDWFNILNTNVIYLIYEKLEIIKNITIKNSTEKFS